ncbi:MAG: FAD-dependent oxidoreductase [Rhodobacterales bacterium]|nr:FAD-dependent oxidoreductase [Rhodobacterales bacterium]
MVTLTRGTYALSGTSLAFKTGTWRVERPVHKHWAAPCHAACPAGEDAQAWIAKVQEKKLQQAWEILVSANPMPAVTGRVCPHPCEQGCNRGSYDQPIAIHNLERFLGDEAIRNNWAYPVPKKAKASAPTVAIVGAGPTGISAAYHCIRLGLKPTIFEALPEAGGLLRSAIPMTRLPRDVLDAELERIFALGIEFKPRHRLGRDINLEELRQDYDAVYLGPGCQRSKEWSVAGAVPGDLADGLHLLKEWVDHGGVPNTKKVVIHGGGNTAMDIARVLKRHGAEEVHLVTASGLPGPDTAPDDILNVVPRELEEGVEEGVIMHPHANLKRLLMRGSKLVGVEMVSLKKLPTASGRKARVSFEGTERVLDADIVIPCIGEAVDPEGMERVLGGSNYFRPDDWGRLSGQDNLLAGGDARGDRGTVSAAVGDGRKAAIALAAKLIDGVEPEGAPRQPIDIASLNLNYFQKGTRAKAPTLPVEERTDHAEIEGSLEWSQVSAEGERCFSCGNCLACDNCWTYCPDNAVLKTADVAVDGSHYVFDYDFCKGCGLCATECPCGYIEMIGEPE